MVHGGPVLGIRQRRASGPDVCDLTEEPHVPKVSINKGRRRAQRCPWIERQQPAQEASGTRGVDDERGLEREAFTRPGTGE